MDLKTIFTIMDSIWNANENNWNVVNFIKALFSYEPGKQMALLQMLPRSWMKEHLQYVEPITLRQLNQKLNYVYKKIADNKNLTQLNMWVLESYFNMLESEPPQLEGQHQYHETFKRIVDSNRLEQLKVFYALGIDDTLSNIKDLQTAWVANYIKSLARQKKKELPVGTPPNLQPQWVTTALPNMEIIQLPQTSIEIIKITDSSWLDTITYDHVKHEATFVLKTAPNMRYTFYSVPRVAVSFIETLRGREMWNGFGLKYSLRPWNWIRKNTFLYYTKYDSGKVRPQKWQKPIPYKNLYKRKPS